MTSDRNRLQQGVPQQASNYIIIFTFIIIRLIYLLELEVLMNF